MFDARLNTLAGLALAALSAGCGAPQMPPMPPVDRGGAAAQEVAARRMEPLADVAQLYILPTGDFATARVEIDGGTVFVHNSEPVFAVFCLKPGEHRISVNDVPLGGPSGLTVRGGEILVKEVELDRYFYVVHISDKARIRDMPLAAAREALPPRRLRPSPDDRDYARFQISSVACKYM